MQPAIIFYCQKKIIKSTKPKSHLASTYKGWMAFLVYKGDRKNEKKFKTFNIIYLNGNNDTFSCYYVFGSL